MMDIHWIMYNLVIYLLMYESFTTDQAYNN
jgi:hypothetical protein